MIVVRRVVLIAVALSLPAAIAVFVPGWKFGVVKGPGTYVSDRPHPPRTREERAAAAVALYYVRAAQRGDPDAACNVAVRLAARRLRCAKAPRLPRALRPGDGRLIASDASHAGAEALIGISDGGELVNVLRMRRWHGIWRVAVHGRDL